MADEPKATQSRCASATAPWSVVAWNSWVSAALVSRPAMTVGSVASAAPAAWGTLAAGAVERRAGGGKG